MKRKALILAVALVAAGSLAALAQYATKVYFDYGGDKLVIASGGEIEVQSGGTVDFQSGATVGATAATITTVTSTTVNATTVSGTTGTFTGAFKLAGAAAPPVACAAGTAGTIYYDSDVNELCVCNASGYVQIDDMTTGCS